MKSRWSSLRANRPYQQAGMSVEVYYHQFCDWKDEINREGYQCSEASIIEDFVNRMTWDLLVRMYGYPSPPFSLSEAFKRAQFEESIISLEELMRQIRADKVFEELSHPISIDTAENQGSEDDNFQLQLKTNEQQWKILNSWSEPENEGKNAEDVSTTVLHPCQIAISQVDEMEKFHSSKIGVLGSGHNMFDEMPELISAVRNKGTDVRGEEVPVVHLPRDLCYGSEVTKVSSFNISFKSMLEEVFMFVDIKNRELDVDFGDDKILICIFDPGGSSLFYDDGDFFELNKEQGDCCFTTIVDDACARSDEYYNDASNGESVCPFSMVVPILQLVVSIQVGIIVKVYDVPSHTGVLPYQELYRFFLEWNGEEILIPTIEKTLIIIKASSELNGEGSSTPKFLFDQNFWWISLIVYFNTVRERGSQLGAYIRVAIKLISQEVKSLFSKAVILKEIGESYTRVVIAGLNPLELWLGTCELDGSLLDHSFTQPPRLFWKWFVWRVVSLCLFSWNLLLASSYEMLGVNRVNSVATGTTLITIDISLESSISFCWDIKKATVIEWPPQNCKWIDNNILAIEFNTTGRQLLWVGYVAALNGDEDDVYFVDKSTEVVTSLSRFGDNHERFFINRSWFVYNGNVAGSPGVDMSH